MRALAEIAYNILEGNFEITEATKTKLKPHRESLRILANKTIPDIEKKEILLKKNKYLTFLLTPFLAVIGSITGKVISSSLGL